MIKKREVMYCELCGSPIEGPVFRITIEGIELVVCGKCYRYYMSRTGKRINQMHGAVFTKGFSKERGARSTPRTIETIPRKEPVPRIERQTLFKSPKTKRKMHVSEKEAERYEIVQDYAARIKKARERLGLSQKELALRVRESERTIRRIEAGVLRPTMDLAKRLERILGIKLLEPIAEVEERSLSSKEDYLTLGDIADIRG